MIKKKKLRPSGTGPVRENGLLVTEKNRLLAALALGTQPLYKAITPIASLADSCQRPRHENQVQGQGAPVK